MNGRQMDSVPRIVMKRTREELGELYERYAPHAHRLALLLLGDQEIASDVVQDAFIRLFGRFRDLRRPEAFEWYLRRTVVNLCRDYQRRLARERAREVRLKAFREPEHESPTTAPSGSLMQAIGRLPLRQRVAVVLRYYEDLSVEETARTMGCSASSVKSLVNRGVSTLREELHELGD